jgi:hypothetical protein
MEQVWMDSKKKNGILFCFALGDDYKQTCIGAKIMCHSFLRNRVSLCSPASLKLTILLPLALKSCDYRHVPPCSAFLRDFLSIGSHALCHPSCSTIIEVCWVSDGTGPWEITSLWPSVQVWDWCQRSPRGSAGTKVVNWTSVSDYLREF